MGSLLAAMGLVFVAELGDKTQLVALGFGARYRLAPVLVGVAVAYAFVNLISVLVGGVLGAALPTRAISLVGGLLFLGFAAWALWGGADRGEGDDAEPEASDPARSPATPTLSVVATVTAAMVVAELGDKTMLATATLAARGNPVLVWVGATVGIVLAGAVGVLVGRFLGARLPQRVASVGSAVLFAVFGVALIASSLLS